MTNTPTNLTVFIKDEDGQLKRFDLGKSTIIQTSKPTLWDRVKNMFTKKERPCSCSWTITTDKLELR